jgi:Lysylphosphatidylglycerol synthase TM region
MTEASTGAKPASGGLRVPRWIDKALLAIGLVLFGYVISRYPFGDIRSAVAGMWPGVALTPLIALSWFVSGSSALYLLLDRRVPWLRVLWIRLVGDSYNSLLPLAGFGGEPFKIRQLSYSVDPAFVMATLIRDRIVDNSMGFFFGATELAVGLTGYSVDAKLHAALLGYIGICWLLGVFGIALVRTRLPGRIGGWLARLLGDVAPEQIDPLPVGRLVQVLACCLTSRMLGVLEKVTLLWVLGLPHDLVTAAFIDGMLNAVGYISFMIPQGLGVFEGTSVFVLGIVGAPGPLAIAFSLAGRSRMLVVGLFGVSLHLAAIVRNAIVRARSR